MVGRGSGPRHRSWASNTNLGALSCLLVLVVYVVVYITSHGNVPTEIKTLLGIAGGAWFGGVTDDKRKKDNEVASTAHRAEIKADDALSRSDASLERETEWSQHRDHRPDDDHKAGRDHKAGGHT